VDFIQQNLIDPVSKLLWNYILIYLLVGAGLYFTISTKFVQARMFPAMLRTLRGSRQDAEGGISSFQAFAVGLASRVGTGNIAGVSIALVLGGPGAVFWMWVVGLLGMSTGLVEASLAQLYKVRSADGSFRGGPAYYIQTGLKSRIGGIIFAVLLIFSFGVAFSMVQTNTIADVLHSAHTVNTTWTAIILVILTAPVVFGGVRRIAKVSEIVMPIFALIYVLLAVIIIAMNFGDIPTVFREIIQGAFGLNPAMAGVAGGVTAAILNGTKRGLFSNEAGMGSAPNAAATATTDHPVKQGLVQSFGVFVDTIVVCSATAFIILFAGPAVYTPGVPTDLNGASLAQAAVSEQLGSWSTWLMTILIVGFAFSSVLGNYYYAEVNLYFLHANNTVITLFRVVVLISVGLGAVIALEAVWAIADVSMALMAIVNLTAILLLFKWVRGLLRDYDASRKAGLDPVFIATGNAYLPAELPGDVWAPATTESV
jgi:AGCS family alanine or glycine:cation symporter